MGTSMVYNFKTCLSKYKWYVLGVILLVLGECVLVGGIGVWREYFWQSVQDKDLNKFILYVGEFTLMALAACLISGYTTYLISYLSLLVRTDLTKIALTKPYQAIEGGEQRVQEDCYNYPFYAVTLLVGILRNTLVFGTFVVIITIQVGPMYLLLPIIYTLVGTGIAGWIAKPLIKLNYMMQVVEAQFRREVLKRASDYIGILRTTHYNDVFHTNKRLFITTKKLSYFQSFYNQITVIVPYLILCPLYFGGKIVFGVFMQVASSMNHVIDSLSYIINSFNDINNWLSCRRRLQELGVLNVKRK
jgi:putative ATP-binding cassette transporter